MDLRCSGYKHACLGSTDFERGNDKEVCAKGNRAVLSTWRREFQSSRDRFSKEADAAQIGDDISGQEAGRRPVQEGNLAWGMAWHKHILQQPSGRHPFWCFPRWPLCICHISTLACAMRTKARLMLSILNILYAQSNSLVAILKRAGQSSWIVRPLRFWACCPCSRFAWPHFKGNNTRQCMDNARRCMDHMQLVC